MTNRDMPSDDLIPVDVVLGRCPWSPVCRFVTRRTATDGNMAHGLKIRREIMEDHIREMHTKGE